MDEKYSEVFKKIVSYKVTLITSECLSDVFLFFSFFFYKTVALTTDNSRSLDIDSGANQVFTRGVGGVVDGVQNE